MPRTQTCRSGKGRGYTPPKCRVGEKGWRTVGAGERSYGNGVREWSRGERPSPTRLNLTQWLVRVSDCLVVLQGMVSLGRLTRAMRRLVPGGSIRLGSRISDRGGPSGCPRQ
jgi:hypothetical protein